MVIFLFFFSRYILSFCAFCSRYWRLYYLFTFGTHLFFSLFFVSLSVRAVVVTEKGSHIGWDCGGVDKIAGSGRSLGNLGIVNLLLAVYVVGAFCIG